MFTNDHTIGSFFNFKDKLHDASCSCIVYFFSCPSCNTGYVGSTSRNLKIRICEHKGISFRPNRQLVNPSYSIIRERSWSNDHCYGDVNFKILCRAKSNCELKIAEFLFIYKNKLGLDKNETTVSLELIP